MFICFFSVCLFVDLIFCFNHLGTPSGNFSENFAKIQLDLAKIFRTWKMFISLFAFYWFVCFCFNHLGTHTANIPRKFVKIWLNLSETFRIQNMFICLFVCLFVCWPFCFFVLIILEHPHEYTLKILWRFHMIWQRY